MGAEPRYPQRMDRLVSTDWLAQHRKGALVKTFVVGQGQPDGGRVQPFRLDEPPRSYAPIAQRELA